ncbi:MAG: lamin tail domain-containing protein, partial [Verrucomicrobiaceae bacterium]|nr:lamin tail domain-containing protein [Verrucomicrobiaceae bacterium]
YFGGPKADYDAVNLNDGFRNDEKVYDGDGVFWNEAKALASSSNPWANNDNNIDVANLIDFMILWLSGDSESEVRLLGSKVQGQPFRFQMKDADGFLRPTGKSVTHQGPLNLMSRLRSGNTDFAMLVADRIHKHFFNDGALTPAKNIERLQKRVNEARLGFIAESARWGDRFREYQNWLDYQQNLVNNHFPGLTQTMISRFRSAGMYPDIIAPVFSQHGGSIAPGAGITMSTNALAIYYTLDGSDPRLPGGAINPLSSIAQFAGDAPNPRDFITTGHLWKYLDDGSDQGNAWRAVNFDDSEWAEGPSELGYAEGDEATRVEFIDTAPLTGGIQRNATTYFRATVELPDPSSYSYFVVKLKYDDGAAVYANGREILRTSNLPENAKFNTFANRATPNEKLFFNFQVPSSMFVNGANSLAVEIHNSSPSSSDISFDLILRGEVDTTDGDKVTKPVIMSEPSMLRARSRNANTGQWSALNEAFFSIGAVPANESNIIISELHYHPSEPSNPEEIAISTDRDDYEFVELLNTGDSPVDLSKVHFSNGITFEFPLNTILNPGKRLVVVRDLEAFTVRYGSDENIFVAGQYTGRLSNDGENLALFSDITGDILEFTYNDQTPWSTLADGAGHSLVAIGSFPSEAGNWGAHALAGGAPGYPDQIITSGYLAWKNNNAIKSDLGDADDDGIPNLVEYGFATNPRSANATALPRTSTLTLGGERYLTITYQRNLAADDVQVQVQSSADLGEWTNDETLVTVSQIVTPEENAVTITRRTAKPVTTHEDTYLRVIVTLQ